jgi:hypothetical protein
MSGLQENSAAQYDILVTSALRDWLEGGQTQTDFDWLSSVLGSHSVNGVIVLDEPAGHGFEKILCAAWMFLLQEYTRSSPLAWPVENRILAGLLQNGRWSTAIEDEHTAHALAMLISSYASRGSLRPWGMPKEHNSLGTIVQAKLGPMLRQWLGKDVSFTAMTPRQFAEVLFGEPWCLLVYDHFADTLKLHDIIARERPAFLAERLALTATQIAVNLPEIGNL